ncbi:probable calcium-binding protein CML46 [Phragmites australis]|uniref:probable calcium-binding protein CML46 n=1 Tax=Phragmites australis TaxID=29695 RepID=UPI002D7A1C22|nr:probable calcium-binding protein CML46 [Phragmites australis]
MAERTMTAAPRPLLRRVLSFREPLLLIPHLLTFLGAAASAFFGSYSTFLQSFARSLFPSAVAKCAHTSPIGGDLCAPCHGGSESVEEEEEEAEEEEEEAVLCREEVEAIMGRIGLGVVGAHGGDAGLAAARMGHDEVSRLFDAEEPSFAEVQSAFAVFDGDCDGFIGAADLQGALARLGVREDAAACRTMITAAGGGRDGSMNLFQFVRFLENGLC